MHDFEDEYNDRDEQIWGDVPPRDGIDQYAREVDPFYHPVEQRVKKYIIDYKCYYCPHNDREWGKGPHQYSLRAHTVGEAVLKAEADIYIGRMNILGVREATE